MAVDNEVFPLAVEYYTASVKFSTSTYENPDGSELRIVNWQDGKAMFTALPGLRSRGDLLKLRTFHRARKGAGRGFLVRDPSDFQFNDNGSWMSLTTGNGTTPTFQLKKFYSDASNSDERIIYKPISGTMFVRVAGVQKTEGTHYTINYLTGMLTFISGNIPANAALIEVKGEFYYVVRFASDDLPSDQAFRALLSGGAADGSNASFGSIPDVVMLELRGEY